MSTVRCLFVFQSPSLRGSGRFRTTPSRSSVSTPVSIPFIAGQWSLHEEVRAQLQKKLEKFQSPSLRGSGRFQPQASVHHCSDICFNPLHCGAVVASGSGGEHRGRDHEFQSPSLRGSGRFGSRPRKTIGFDSSFQSPSLRGSGRFVGRGDPGRVARHVSIPFIAGQWSLRSGDRRRAAGPGAFQSPSLRGSGRF
jgi:hypothetical protein